MVYIEDEDDDQFYPGFWANEVARNSDFLIAIGVIENGDIVIALETAGKVGVKYTKFSTIEDAYDVFDDLVEKNGLWKIENYRR